MRIFFIIALIFLILFLPIPLKISFKLDKKYYEIKIYNIILFSPNKGLINKVLAKISKSKNSSDKASNKNNDTLKAASPPKKHKPKKRALSLKALYKNISTNRFKPLLKINGSIDFGLEDAASSAILYGTLCNLPALLNILLSKVFKVNNLNLNIIPHFKNTNVLSLNIKSIFYFNIANIIYILFLTYISFEKNKEVIPE